MKRLLVCLMAIFAFSGCATTDVYKQSRDRYKEKMDLFLGEDESFLVRMWGPPDRAYELDGVKYLRYSSSRTVPYPTPLQIGAPFYNRFVMYGGGAASMNCDNTFEINHNGIVVAWRFKGNGCR
jgi:hypothetical protein